MTKPINWDEVVEAAKVDPHAYRHEWGKTALDLLTECASAAARMAVVGVTVDGGINMMLVDSDSCGDLLSVLVYGQIVGRPKLIRP